MPYVYSTLSSDQTYCQYQKKLDPKKIPQILERIFINGKANVVNKNTFITPKGVVTEITDEQLKILETIPAFKNHKEAGFIKVDTSQTDPEKVAKADMTAKDKSAQLVESDFDPKRKPIVNDKDAVSSEPVPESAV